MLSSTANSAYMTARSSLEKAQELAIHAHISTTMLYERSDDDKVEEIRGSYSDLY